MSIIQNAPPKERFHYLDGLRAFAAIFTILHHSVSSAIVRVLQSWHFDFLASWIAFFTQSGVVLFFIMSGIVLLRPYMRDGRKLKIGQYYYRRVKRIYPPYLGALIFGYIVICIIKFGPETFYSPLWVYSDVSLLAFLKQVPIISFSGVFYNLAWWSLQIEVVFYFLTPVYVIFFFLFVKKLNYFQVFGTLLLVLTGFFLLQLYLSDNYPEIYSNTYVVANVYRFIDYPISFLLGAYVARFDFQPFVGGVFMIFGSILILFTNQYVPLINAGYSFLYAGVVVYAFRKKWLQRFLSHPILIWIGERTYSLFLVHFSVFYLVNYLFSLVLSGRNIYYGVFTRSVGILLAVFFSMLLFHFVERRQAKGLVTGNIFWPWHLKRLKLPTVTASSKSSENVHK